jgi:radical SAM superfamily enzyme YgiQ (UPF0313 family)
MAGMEDIGDVESEDGDDYSYPINVERKPLNHEHRHIREKLLKEGKRLWDPGYYVCWDSNLNLPSTWEASKLKVLIVFLSTAEARAVSSTENVLNALIKADYGDDVFVDYCHMPTADAAAVFAQWGIPHCFGNVSLRSWKEYDVIAISNSTIEEKINLVHMMLDSEIPIWHTERLNMPEIPLIVMGGNSSEMSEIMLGKSEDGQNQSFVDAIIAGAGEASLSTFVGRCLHWKMNTGNPPSHDRLSFIKSLYDQPWWYYPLAYDHVYADDGWTITEIRHLDEEAPYPVKFNNVEDIGAYAGFEKKVIHPANSASWDSTDLQISQGCSSGGACSFCKEGHVSGGWREKSPERMRVELELAKMYSLSSKICFFSYNSNYYARYLDLMYEAADVFSSLSVIAMRADIISARPEYFHMNRRLGMRRVSFGIEGASERIRNGYLNKNLDENEMLRAFRAVFQCRLLEVKMLMISTGYEEKADFDEFIALIDRILALRDQEGATTGLRLTITTLAHYPETGIAWDERRGLRNVLERRKSFMYLLLEMKKRGIRTKFTAKGMQPIYPQIILDGGRIGTSVIEKAAKEGIRYYRNLKNTEIDRFVELSAQKGITIDRVVSARPDDWIFPGDHIHSLDPKYIKRMKRSLRKFKQANMCLATVAKPENRVCHSCGYCDGDMEMVQARINRKFDNNHTVEEVLALIHKNLPRFRMRVAVDYSETLSLLAKTPLFHYAASRVVREMVESGTDSQAHMKVSHIAESSVGWMIQASQNEAIAGKAVFDILLREKMDPEQFMSAFSRVRGEILSLKVLSAKIFPIESKIEDTDTSIYVMRPSEYDPRLSGLIRDFDGEYRVPVKTAGSREPVFERKSMPDIPSPLFAQNSAGTYMVSAIPLRMNPYTYISSITNTKFRWVYEGWQVSCIGTYRTVQASTCTHCKNEHAMMDLATGKMMPFGEKCLRRTIITKLQDAEKVART